MNAKALGGMSECSCGGKGCKKCKSKGSMKGESKKTFGKALLKYK